MQGVTVEGNGWYGIDVFNEGVAQLEGCSVTGNTKGDYNDDPGGRIER